MPIVYDASADIYRHRLEIVLRLCGVRGKEACHLLSDCNAASGTQLSLFDETEDNEKERRIQESILQIKKKYGKNSILKGMNFEDGATAMERNAQIGGHKA